MAQDRQNVFVGISVRNKTLTAGQVDEIISHSREKLSARRVLFLIADELELINLRVFNPGTTTSLTINVDERVEELKRIIETGLAHADRGQLNVTIDTWASITNADYWSTYVQIFSRFLESIDFQRDLQAIIARFVARRGGSATIQQTQYLSLYLLGELPTLLQGVRYRGRKYCTMIYPVRGDEAIDNIAKNLADGQYGNPDGLSQVCEVVRMPA